MRLLLINHYAGSPKHGMEFRPYYLAQEWRRQGCDVRIEAATFSHLRRVNPDQQRHTQFVDDVQYSWWRTPSYVGNGLGRAVNMASFTTQLTWNARAIAQSFHPDVVVASSTYPFDIFPARRIASAVQARLAYEVHDLWPLTPVEVGGMSRTHPFVLACGLAERYAYRNADCVVSMLPAAERYMRQNGLAAGKFVYVPNGIDVAAWEGPGSSMPQEHAELCRSLRAQGRFIVGYAGSHGIANALDTLVDAAAMLRDVPVSIVMVGQGPDRERLHAHARAKGLQNVHFLPTVPKDCVPALLASMDAVYLGWLRRSIYRFGISPNKILDYMMAARPIVHSVEAGNDPVAESGCGYSILPEQPSAVADAIVQLFRLDEGKRREMGERGRRFVLEHHDYRVLARRFLDATTGKSGYAKRS
jgi:glycosyltransferase involved in cell wall biosynthesis